MWVCEGGSESSIEISSLIAISGSSGIHSPSTILATPVSVLLISEDNGYRWYSVGEKQRIGAKECKKTYNSENSRVVTQSTNTSPVSCVCIGDRTGYAVFGFLCASIMANASLCTEKMLVVNAAVI